jgi:hypothetical protein
MALRRSPALFSFVPSTSWPEASMGVLPSSLRQVPTISKFSREKPIGSMILWQLAHGSTLRCSSNRCRKDVTFTCSASLSRFVSTPGGGTGAGIPKTFSRIHRPRVTEILWVFDCRLVPSIPPSSRFGQTFTGFTFRAIDRQRHCFSRGRWAASSLRAHRLMPSVDFSDCAVTEDCLTPYEQNRHQATAATISREVSS